MFFTIPCFLYWWFLFLMMFIFIWICFLNICRNCVIFNKLYFAEMEHTLTMFLLYSVYIYKSVGIFHTMFSVLVYLIFNDVYLYLNLFLYICRVFVVFTKLYFDEKDHKLTIFAYIWPMFAYVCLCLGYVRAMFGLCLGYVRTMFGLCSGYVVIQ